jgi:hypothetical protein
MLRIRLETSCALTGGHEIGTKLLCISDIAAAVRLQIAAVRRSIDRG